MPGYWYWNIDPLFHHCNINLFHWCYEGCISFSETKHALRMPISRQHNQSGASDLSTDTRQESQLRTIWSLKESGKRLRVYKTTTCGSKIENQSSEHITGTVEVMETELSYRPSHPLLVPNVTVSLKICVHYFLCMKAEHLISFWIGFLENAKGKSWYYSNFLDRIREL